MRIDHIHIDNFGRHRNLDVALNPRFSVLYGPNESGKSTLLDFILCVLYGFSRYSRKDIRQNERLRYLPWRGEGYGGHLIFEHAGVSYRLERAFGDTAAHDRVRLTHLALGDEVDLGKEEPGEYLLGLKRSEFINSIFIGQLSTVMSEDKDIRDKLSSRFSGAGMETSVSRIIASLTKEKEILQPPRKVGVIKRLAAELRDLENEAREAELAVETSHRMRSDLSEAKAKLDDLRARQARMASENEIRRSIAESLRFQKLKGLKDHIDALTVRLDASYRELNIQSSDALPQEDVFRFVEKRLADLAEGESALQNTEEALAALLKARETLPEKAAVEENLHTLRALDARVKANNADRRAYETRLHDAELSFEKEKAQRQEALLAMSRRNEREKSAWQEKVQRHRDLLSRLAQKEDERRREKDALETLNQSLEGAENDLRILRENKASAVESLGEKERQVALLQEEKKDLEKSLASLGDEAQRALEEKTLEQNARLRQMSDEHEEAQRRQTRIRNVFVIIAALGLVFALLAHFVPQIPEKYLPVSLIVVIVSLFAAVIWTFIQGKKCGERLLDDLLRVQEAQKEERQNLEDAYREKEKEQSDDLKKTNAAMQKIQDDAAEERKQILLIDYQINDAEEKKAEREATGAATEKRLRAVENEILALLDHADPNSEGEGSAAGDTEEPGGDRLARDNADAQIRRAVSTLKDHFAREEQRREKDIEEMDAAYRAEKEALDAFRFAVPEDLLAFQQQIDAEEKTILDEIGHRLAGPRRAQENAGMTDESIAATGAPPDVETAENALQKDILEQEKTLERLRAHAAAVEKAEQERDDRQKQLSALREVDPAYRPYLPKAGESAKEAALAFRRFMEAARALRRTEAALSEREKELRNFLGGKTWEELEADENERREALKAKEASRDSALAALKDDELRDLEKAYQDDEAATHKRIGELESSLNQLLRQVRVPLLIQKDLAAKQAELTDATEKLSDYERALSLMHAVDAKMQESFGPEIGDRTSRILAELTGEDAQKLIINQKFEAMLEDPESRYIKEYSYFSAGKIDQIYMAMRLAIALTLYRDDSGSPLPFIFDDAFVQYDTGRATAAFHYLRKIADEEDRQIIFATCHRHYLDLLHLDDSQIIRLNPAGSTQKAWPENSSGQTFSVLQV